MNPLGDARAGTVVPRAAHTGGGRALARVLHRLAPVLHRLAPAQRILRKARDRFPLTWLGVAVLAFAIGSLRWLAFGEMDLVALVLGWGAVGLVLVSALIVCVAASVGAIVLAREPGRALRIPTESPIPSGYSLPSLAWVPLLTIDARIVRPATFDRTLDPVDGRLVERLSVRARGAHESIVRELSFGDVFGLTRISFERVEPREVFVTPHLGRLTQMPTLRSLASGDALAHPAGTPDGDRLDLRRYSPGDPARFIHWKVYARTRKLVVRVPERALAPSQRVVAYLVAGPGDEPTAALALAAVRFDALGDDWLFGADGSPVPTADLDQATTAIVRSVAHVDDGGRDLEAFLRAVEREGPASLVLFLPPNDGPALERVLAVARPRGIPTQVVIGVDLVRDERRRGLVDRLVSTHTAAGGVDRITLDSVRARLQTAGANVLVVERPTGRVLASHGRVSAELAGPGRAA